MLEWQLIVPGCTDGFLLRVCVPNVFMRALSASSVLCSMPEAVLLVRTLDDFFFSFSQSEVD